MNIKKITLLLGILSVLSIIGISFITWRFCDDFHLEKQLQSRSVIDYMTYLYKNWDGRFISIASFFQLSAIKYLDNTFVVFIWSFFFVLNCLIVYVIIIREAGQKLVSGIKEYIILQTVVIISLFYGFATHISETVYFQTGGAYMLHTFFGLIWILAIEIIFRDAPRRIEIILFLFYSLIVGFLTQNLVICLIVLLFYKGYEFLEIKEKRSLIYIGLIFGCLLSGLILTSFSPGSLIRAAHSPNSFDNDLVNYVKYFYNISKVFIRASLFLIPLSIFAGFIIYLNIDFQTPVIKVLVYRNSKMIFHRLKWIIVAGSSTLPFIFIPNTVTYRSSLFFMLFLFVFLVIITLEFLIKYDFRHLYIFKRWYNFLLNLIFILHLGFTSYSYKIGLEYQKFMCDNDKYLMSKSGTEETVSIKNLILPYNPFMFKSAIELFISQESDYWVNKEWSFYYDIKIIKAE